MAAAIAGLFRTRKGTTLRTEHTKRNAGGDFSQATGSGDKLALRQLTLVRDSLADSKAENIVAIDIAGKSALGDHMVVASGRSNRHVASICDHLITELKAAGFGDLRVEGLATGDWVLIDAGDIIIHIFRPEIREFYNIEKMWQVPDMEDGKLH
ncbi:ribosome silencing factor [Hoeflea sp. YIM 152468]|uniref:ribosome silencing factor n=1 Tax=Hoeflea sp. YIM 152468 TaxID=3031759 RepID=UPI0023DAFE08|nr:ribosome silencing factor [Hoeflea sp. YIM 152468]MDF1609174.1 ribosome silencing factor [Hoeflea sp. YIM 152468]